MSDTNENEPRIIVDDDWKSAARREKEEADRETRDMPGLDEIPEASFVELLQMIIMQASIGLGGMQDPHTGQQIPPNLPLAKHYIDLLGLLQTKTKGNLDEEEQKIMDATLHELRLAFVQISSAAAGVEAPEVEGQ